MFVYCIDRVKCYSLSSSKLFEIDNKASRISTKNSVFLPKIVVEIWWKCDIYFFKSWDNA